MGKKKVAKVRRLVKYRRVKQRQKAKKPARTINAKVNARQVLHGLWFSKKNESFMERGRRTEVDVRALAKEMDFYERQMERRLQEVEKNAENRIDDLKKRTEAFQKSVDAVNSSVAALRKENEELKKDRQVLSDKIKNMMTEREEFELGEPVTSGTLEKERIPEPESSFADHRSEKKIETSMDSLLDLIIKKGSIKVPEAAKRLQVKDSEIEEWARILEEHDLIDIHYPTIGKPVLKKKT